MLRWHNSCGEEACCQLPGSIGWWVETSGLPGCPSHSHHTRLLLHHQCPFSTLERKRDLIWLLEKHINSGVKDSNLTYLTGVLCGKITGVVLNLHLMCFTCSGPYKDQVMSPWRASRGDLGAPGMPVMHRGNQDHSGRGLHRACSCAEAAARAPASWLPAQRSETPGCQRCPFQGQKKQPQRRKLEKGEISCLYLFLSMVLFYSYT